MSFAFTTRIKHFVLALAAIGLLSYFSGQASAAILRGSLTGDPRAENPDGLVVNVTITFDDTGDRSADFTVDVNSPLHEDVKLDFFAFNLDLATLGIAADDISFTDLSPNSWGVATGLKTPAGGFGNAAFTFTAVDSKDPKKNDVTNDVPLLFTANLPEGAYWSLAAFTNADPLSGAAGAGQLGAHLQSLDTSIGGDDVDTDSGMALGYYVSGPVNNTTPVPEPASIAIWSLGLLGCAAYRRRMKQKAA